MASVQTREQSATVATGATNAAAAAIAEPGAGVLMATVAASGVVVVPVVARVCTRAPTRPQVAARRRALEA